MKSSMTFLKDCSSSATGHNDTEISKMSDENISQVFLSQYSISSISKAQGTLQNRGPKTIRDKR